MGFGFCALGCLLYAVNFLAAALYVPHVTQWPTAGGRIAGGFEAVGYTPTIAGVLMFGVGLIMILRKRPEK